MTPRQYELVYLMPGDTSEQDAAGLQTQIEGIVARYSGTLDKTENWGRRKLAYEIGPHKEAVYVLHVITGSGDLMKEIDRRLKVLDRVIRHMAVRVDEEMRVVDRVKARRQAETARRRVARGLPPEPEPAPVPVAAPADQAPQSQSDQQTEA